MGEVKEGRAAWRSSRGCEGGGGVRRSEEELVELLGRVAR